MDQVHKNIDNAEKLFFTTLENGLFPLCQNRRQKIKWNIEFVLTGSPTTNVIHVCCRKERRKV